MNIGYCDHPLEYKWTEQPVIEVCELYERNGQVCLDPDGHLNGGGYMTVHCNQCDEVYTVTDPNEVVL